MNTVFKIFLIFFCVISMSAKAQNPFSEARLYPVIDSDNIANASYVVEFKVADLQNISMVYILLGDNKGSGNLKTFSTNIITIDGNYYLSTPSGMVMAKDGKFLITMMMASTQDMVKVKWLTLYGVTKSNVSTEKIYVSNILND